MCVHIHAVPLCGSNRKSYFMATAWLAAVGYVVLWLRPPSRPMATSILFAVNLFGYSCVDSCDAHNARSLACSVQILHSMIHDALPCMVVDALW